MGMIAYNLGAQTAGRELTAEETALLKGPHRSEMSTVGGIDVLKAASYGMVAYGAYATAASYFSPTTSGSIAANTGATTKAAASKWSLSGLIKDYGGTALKLLMGSSAPSGKDAANNSDPYNLMSIYDDYGGGYGEGGGMGGGAMLTTGGAFGESDDEQSFMGSPIFVGGSIIVLLLAAFFFLRR